MSRKINDLEVKYSEKKEEPAIVQRIEEVYNIETRHAILMAINTFGSSNIKRLARILSKNEATIFYHIKNLTAKPELLQIDTEAMRVHKGIYYKLTDLAKKYFCEPTFETIETIFSELSDVMLKKSDEEIADFYFQLLAKNPDIVKSVQRDRRQIAYNRILENFMLNNLERTGLAVKGGAKPKNKRYPIGSIEISNIDMKISTPRQLFEILKVITELFTKLAQLKTKFAKEMNDKAIPEEERIAVHYHLAGGEIAEFDLEF